MSFGGEIFSDLWNRASDLGRKGAELVSSGIQSLGEQTSHIADNIGSALGSRASLPVGKATNTTISSSTPPSSAYTRAVESAQKPSCDSSSILDTLTCKLEKIQERRTTIILPKAGKVKGAKVSMAKGIVGAVFPPAGAAMELADTFDVTVAAGVNYTSAAGPLTGSVEVGLFYAPGGEVGGYTTPGVGVAAGAGTGFSGSLSVINHGRNNFEGPFWGVSGRAGALSQGSVGVVGNGDGIQGFNVQLGVGAAAYVAGQGTRTCTVAAREDGHVEASCGTDGSSVSNEQSQDPRE